MRDETRDSSRTTWPQRVRERWKPVWQAVQWPVLGGLWVVALVLGYIGAGKELAAASKPGPPAELFYRALQLFVLDDSVVVSPPIVSWELAVARFLAPAVAAYTAVQALVAIFREQLQSLRLRRIKNHVVICGLGRKGLQLAQDFHRQADRVVVIEHDEGNEYIRYCREEGVIVLLGDASDQSLLRKARVHRAKYVIGVCGDDGANVEMAVHAHELVREGSRAPAPRAKSGADERAASLARPKAKTDSRVVKYFVHLFDLELRNLFKQSRIYTQTDDRFELSFFNIFENSARQLLDDFSPDRYADTVGGERVHLLVVGFGQLGECVLLQAAKIGHYANGKELCVTVIDREAKKKEAMFRLRYPQLDQACEARFLQMDTKSPAFHEGSFLREAEGICPLTAIYVCLDDESHVLSCALTLRPKLARSNTPIVVRMREDAGFAALLRNRKAKQANEKPLHAFGMIHLTCRREMVLNDVQDRLARAIHEDYVRKAKEQGDTVATNPSLVPWGLLPEDLEDSNRQQADHILVKLRAVRCSAHPIQGSAPIPFEFTAEEIELLARMEHARWCAERYLAGWIYAPGRKNTPLKTNPNLIDYEKLLENIKEYDREAVRNIPNLLALIEQEIRRQTRG